MARLARLARLALSYGMIRVVLWREAQDDDT